MKKFFKWTFFVIVILVIVLFAAFRYMQHETKKKSPEATVAFDKGGRKISVFYNRPSKRGREIFGSLVPYGQVWRTGANEATTFTTETDLVIGGKPLKKGKYTLWTIPGKEEWIVIFNTKEYGWGIKFGGEAAREPEADALQITVPVQKINAVVEQFTISFSEDESLKMDMMWDTVKVSVPIQ